jgi:archaellin
MVLVAAIAAGVLIDTAGLLQAQASQTGEESTAEVSDTLQLSRVVGDVGGSGSIDTIKIKTRLAAGSGPIDLSKTVFIIESEGKTDTITGSSATITSVQGTLTSGSILTDGEDVADVEITLSSADVDNLAEGDEIRIVAQAPSGGSSEIHGKAPKDLQDSHIL